MKLLFLALGVYFPEGGIERFNQRVLRVLSGMIQNGLVEHVTTISLRDKSNNPENLPQNIQFLGFSRNKLSTLFAFLKEIFLKKPDMVLFGHVLFSPVALLNKIFLPHTKTVLFIHGDEVWDNPSRLSKWLCKKGFDKVISVSRYTAQTMSDNFNFSESRFSIICNAIDSDSLHNKEKHQINLDGNFNLLSVCRLSLKGTHKNIDKVILSIPEILKKFPNTHYYVIGDGDWRKDLEMLARENQVQEYVHFLGWLKDDERDAYYEKSDIFVLPSVGEGFGIVFLEAWKYKRPIITSNKGAAPEVVENNLGGLCIDPTPNNIAQSIILLLSDKALCQSFGNFGYQKVVSSYLHQHFETLLINSLLTNEFKSSRN